MGQILTERDLAELLHIDEAAVARLVAAPGIPWFSVGGELRFVKARVIEWLALREGSEVLPPEPEPEPEPEPDIVALITLPSAGEGEVPFVSAQGLDALGAGAGDPGRNLDRLQVRDALLGLNDALLPLLGRLGDGRLHPPHDEKARTSPWRVNEGGAPISAISIAWGEGERAAPGFVDRARVEVEVSARELRVALVAPRGFSEPPSDSEVAELRASGLAVALEGADGPTIAKVYPIRQPAPSLSALREALEADLSRIVPLWKRSR